MYCSGSAVILNTLLQYISNGLLTKMYVNQKYGFNIQKHASVCAINHSNVHDCMIQYSAPREESI